jgi:hypothetical protein
MDPVTALITGHIAGKVIDRVGASFRSQVIERWSKRRAQAYFEQFCEQLSLELSGIESAWLDDLLEKMLVDEACTELLFDSYRRVCLSRSKMLGPKVLGILSAQLAIERRQPTQHEESMMDACERLTDTELIDFATFVDEQRKRAESPAHKDVSTSDQDILQIKWCMESLDSNWHRDSSVSLAPLNLGECLGSWAARLCDLGILSSDVKERKWDYREDSDMHVDEPGSVREISWWLYLPTAYFRLAELIRRVSPAPNNAE